MHPTLIAMRIKLDAHGDTQLSLYVRLYFILIQYF